MRRAPLAGLAGLLTFASLATFACGPIDKLLGKDTPTPTPSTSGSPTPTNTGTPTPLPSPSVTTSGEIMTFDWGTVALPAGQSPTFSFTAPANTIGVQFQAIGGPADVTDFFLFFSVTSPAGTVIDNSAGGPEQQAPNTGLAAFSLPSSDSSLAAVSAGTYTFHVAAFSAATGNPAIASTPHVLAKVRVRAGGLATSNILDLNVVGVAGAEPVAWSSATDVQNSVVVQNALTEMDTDYSSIGISLGTINYFFLNDSSFATITSESQLEQMFQLSSQTGNNLHTIFLVNDLSGLGGGGGGSVVGISGGIPIPHDNNGTLHSGAAVSMSQFATGTGMGDDMAHETGHALGLFHTTESDGTTHDPISDTLECDAATMNANPGNCPDSGNVMFWLLEGGSPTFSTGQGTVVRPAINLHSGASFAPQSPALGTSMTAARALAHGGRLGPHGMVIYCALRTPRVSDLHLPIPTEGLRSLD